MKLYHFTSARNLYGIGLYGLTVGDVPTDIKRERGRIGVWLTANDAPDGHGLDGGAADKSRFRLTVNVPEHPLLVPWVDWATHNATPETVRALHATATSFATWYIYFGVVPRAQIEECVDMQSGLVVEDWGAKRSEQDMEPVPPWRRHAWHKKLLKAVRRELTLGR
jgi:hypothetical protein